MAHDPLADFTTETFSFGGKPRTVYRQGTGPAVIVMAEVPGITPRVADFARTLVEHGFSVFMPHLFGRPGEGPSAASMARTIVPACVSKEFRAFALGTTPPAIDWLRALARDAHERCGGPGVGAVGMCFTGGFALAMATEPSLLAPVLSQPSLPIGPRGAAAVGCSDADLLTVKERDDLCVLGLRFSGDKLSPGARFATLRRELGDRFIGVELPTPADRPRAHSVLTEDLVHGPDEPTWQALQQVLAFLSERLHTV
ncbi:MAG: dienelactone hydrolase family protein [Actinomycetes bacterium]